MADNKKIEIVIRYENAPSGTTGNGSSISSGSSSSSAEKAKQKQMAADFKAHEQELLNIKRAADKQMAAEEKAYQKEIQSQQRAAQKSQVAQEKAHQKEILNAEKQANAQRIAEEKKIAAANSNTWGNAINSYQFKFNALGNIISNVVSTSTRMLYQLGSSVVTISKDFEFAMSGVKAITGATDEEFNALRNDAIRLGGSTLYTATEISNLQTELAKLGFTTSEIHAATDGVVALAAATGEDLSQSALVAGTVIRAFGLSANDLTGVVDVMAQAFNSSALDLYKFSETMKYVAPVAAKTGFTVSEVTAMMAKLADQGIVASQAGTGLRNLLLRLADANSKLSKAIGFPVSSLAELVVGFNKLKLAGTGATEMLKLTDRYSITAGLGLISASESMYELYKSMVSVSGESQKMSDIRMDNFAGSVEKLSGAWDSFVLSINKGNGVLKFAVDETKFWVEQLTKLISSIKTIKEMQAGEEISQLKKDLDERIADVNGYYTNLKALQVEAETDGQNLANENLKKGLITQKEYDKKLIELHKIHGDEVKKLTAQQEKELSFVKISFLKDEFGRQHRKTLTLLDNEKKDKELLAVAQGYYQYKGALKALEYTQAEINASKIKEEEITKILNEADLERQQMLIDAYAAQDTSIEEYTKEQIRLAKEKEKNRLELLRDGMGKEIAIIESKYKEEKDKAIENGNWNAENSKNWELNKQDDINKVKKEYAEKAIKIETDYYETISEITLREKEFKEYGARVTYFERKRWIDENIKDEIKRAELIAANEKKLAESSSMQKLPSKGAKVVKKLAKTSIPLDESYYNSLNIWEKLGIEPFTSEQMNAMKKGFNFLADELQKMADKEKEIADQRVENSENLVSQLQQDLQTEIALAEAGFASNVSLKQRELDAAKKQQAVALAEQEIALKKQQKLEAASQLADLLSASAGILKGAFKEGPILGMVLSGVALATMWGSWIAAKSQAASLTAYGDGGEINGPKHSQGGVPIVAEGGEYMIRADAYKKNKDLVQAINNNNRSEINNVLGSTYITDDKVTVNNTTNEGVLITNNSYRKNSLVNNNKSQHDSLINNNQSQYDSLITTNNYAQYESLMNAIRNNELNQVYGSLTKDMTVSLDDSKTAELMGKMLKDKKQVTYFNGGRVETIGNRRRVIRNA